MKKIIQLFLIIVFTIVTARADYEVAVDLDRESGLYRLGETATFSVSFAPGGKVAPGSQLRYIMKFDAQILKTGILEANGEKQSFEFTADRPGWIYFGLEALDSNGKPRSDLFRHRTKPTIINEIGAVFSPEQIIAKPSRPADFDEYWASLRARLDEVPIRAQLTPVKDLPADYQDKVECFAVSVDCYGANPVTGYLALPRDAKPQSLPALVNYQGLSWRDADRNAALRSAAAGAIAFATTWHGAPTGWAMEQYKKDPVIGTGAYHKFNIDNRELWFFRDMYIRVMRSLDYIKSRPEWNGRDLVVQGGSGGGCQAAVAAAVDDAVTLAVISVPSQCEFNALESGRMPLTPFRNSPKRRDRIRQEPQVAKTAAYFDIINFAPKIRCEVYVANGFTDESCYPGNIYAFYNAIPATTAKAITTHPRTGHFGTTWNVKGNARLKALFSGITVYE